MIAFFSFFLGVVVCCLVGCWGAGLGPVCFVGSVVCFLAWGVLGLLVVEFLFRFGASLLLCGFGGFLVMRVGILGSVVGWLGCLRWVVLSWPFITRDSCLVVAVCGVVCVGLLVGLSSRFSFGSFCVSFNSDDFFIGAFFSFLGAFSAVEVCFGLFLLVCHGVRVLLCSLVVRWWPLEFGLIDGSG